MNCHLAARNLVVNNLLSDLKDGVLLANLIELLSETQIKYIPSPKTITQALDNLNSVFTVLQSLGVNLRGCGVEGNVLPYYGDKIQIFIKGFQMLLSVSCC